MTPNQQVLSDGQIIEHLEAAGVKFQRFMGGISGTKEQWSTSGSQDVHKIIAGIRAIESATLAALAQQAQPMHQFRRRLCADWYDGHPDHEDGGGPYETRILYTAPPAPQPSPVDERAAFKAELAGMPEWEPDFKHHRAWVEPLLWVFWQARATLKSPAPQTKGQP